MRVLRAGLAFGILLGCTTMASGFDLQTYRDHLQRVRSWTGEQLIQAHAP
jgi:hypothetical protein